MVANKFHILCIILCFSYFPFLNGLDLPPEIMEIIAEIHSSCQTKFGVTTELLNQAHEGTLPDDQGFKCYLHCLMETGRLINRKNIIHLEYTVNMLPDEYHGRVNNLVEKCGTQSGVDSCDIVYQTVKCYYDVDRASMDEVFSFLF